MIKSFDWFTTRTYVDNSSNWKLLTSTPHNLYKRINFFSLYGRLFDWLTVSGEIVPREYFYHTSCHLNKGTCSNWVFLSDSLSTYRFSCLLFPDKLSPCWRIKAYLLTLSDVTCKHERNDWQFILLLVFPFLKVLPFMVFLYLTSIRLTYSLHCYRHYYFCIATIKLLKLLR